jgi:hypothetical protein
MALGICDKLLQRLLGTPLRSCTHPQQHTVIVF